MMLNIVEINTPRQVLFCIHVLIVYIYEALHTLDGKKVRPEPAIFLIAQLNTTAAYR
jgi:hypothetical protein